MCDRFLEDYGILIDWFKRRPHKRAYVHFLTHVHTDHTDGLKVAKWHGDVIYGSADTCRFVVERYKGVPAEKLRVIPLVTPVDFDTFTVCAYPSGHTLGSIMLVFDIPGRGRVLYTGDWVWCHSTPSTLRAIGQVDEVLMDSTMLDADIPKRTPDPVDFIRRIRKRSPRKIRLLTMVTGIEIPLLEAGMTFHVRHDVKPDIHMLLAPYGVPEADAEVVLVPADSVDPHAINIMFTATWFFCNNKDPSRAHKTDDGVMHVFFRTHASEEETAELIRRLNVTSIQKKCYKAARCVRPKSNSTDMK